MTRDKLARRFRVIAPLLAVAGAFLLIAWLGHRWREARKPVGPPAGDASLLLLADGEPLEFRLLRVPVKDGEPQPPEQVWEGPVFTFAYSGRRQIIGGRYVVTAGGVIDVWEKRAFHEPGGELLDANDERVVYNLTRRLDTQGIFALDLQTRTVKRLTGADEAPYLLPGARSPDRTKSISIRGHDLTLHRVGQPPFPLGEFRVERSTLSSIHGYPPVLWLDNERFLTQNGNGNLITVALDGTRTPVVKVLAKTDDSGPHLNRDPDGRIVYSYFRGERFIIAVNEKTAEQCEWVSLGHGFEASWPPEDRDVYTILYRGQVIGRHRVDTLLELYTTSTDGHLAFRGREGVVCVYSSQSGKWTTLDIRANGFIGWLKE